ncbi:MAG: formate--tetrahydrofolate ligase [Bacilli bacterium]|nr:formate--tetrahydrofolate ligase [Bacilli bacterium]
MLKDYEIASRTNIQDIKRIANLSGFREEDMILYGKSKAKIGKTKTETNKVGKLILVTSINPTPYGEGKTTVAIGLHDGLRKLNVNSMLALREPSLGPVFGIKGGACGGGYAQVVPMDEINLHFTGDFHAITTANNLICAMIDNVLYHGNSLDLNEEEIYFTRTMDLNDRALRNIRISLGEKERNEKFTITAACEVMSTLCMAKDIEDLRTRLDKMIIGKNHKNEFVYVKDLNITGALLAILKDAIKPNLVQTLENNPVLIHGGQFANIAPGCNSISATQLALQNSDITITEAGFGFDLGGFKFIDIVSRNNNLTLSGIVLVVTVKALEYNGGDLNNRMESLQKGICNLGAHMENIEKCQIPYVVTLNKFESDTEQEIRVIKEYVEARGKTFVINEAFTKGGEGTLDLAKEVLKLNNQEMHYLYKKENTIKEKIEKVCKEILHAGKVEYEPIAEKKIRESQEEFGELPICIAKTQYSLSDDKNKLGDPRDYTMTVKDIRIYNGAGFITVYLGNIMTMPGLSKEPAATKIDVDNDTILNIF